ncbi:MULTISPECIES: L-lactate dehydrogenase [unclassified Lactobacillus]|uniref:L-lactate dehydrogenase n=1 Tax=unclassified Lactobacillus TaxID=2620435 RepID=UPI000EFB1F87|nr:MULTISPECIES: L-lactate dehydrogenase [unclassified Lactobacillus]RMC40020.1 L-lactate dehydrogenase [Lactobacillus sp. ESL0237]RMC44181.1 L-lactate dehydrogenase [Lactobacillus sp. ESL0234]RMC45509.1 L-lactate dehydrogenase [Lactobacillus sp. ESL0236]RMC46471.1 L-lactate dehydrogenase [Lactobacillus sp. ESL0230]RMC50772.1 L-lactate dehydrogenase [Lactobacillus sp. ESL0225]
MNRKVLLVGDGAVGSTFANDLLQQTHVNELIIADVVKERPVGDSMDLEDITPFVGDCNIHPGEYSDAKDADVVVITAGIPRKPGETRLDLVNKNAAILKSIIEPVVASGFNGIFVVSANPVDILTTLTQKLSGFPKNKVIGTGTSLDSARLQVELAQKLSVPIASVNSMVLGEHGDTSFENFDESTVAGKSLRQYSAINDQVLSEIETDIRQKGGKIIENKGATFYGIAMMLAQIVSAILDNHAIVLPLSAPINGEYGIQHELYLGTPTAIDGSGISHVIEANLSDREIKKMINSADKMHEILVDIKVD